jgi:hypothetical protein
MTQIAGAIVILAGAIVFSTSMVLLAWKEKAVIYGFIIAVFLGLTGLVMVYCDWADQVFGQRKRRHACDDEPIMHPDSITDRLGRS